MEGHIHNIVFKVGWFTMDVLYTGLHFFYHSMQFCALEIKVFCYLKLKWWMETFLDKISIGTLLCRRKAGSGESFVATYFYENVIELEFCSTTKKRNTGMKASF